MTLFFVYAGRMGGGLDSALAIYGVAKQAGIDAKLVLSTDNERRAQVEKLYPEAEFYNFLSPQEVLSLRSRLQGGLSFFTMFSPKIVPLFHMLRSNKIFYSHASYDHSFSRETNADRLNECLTDRLVRNSTLTVTTQYPLAWQIRIRLGKKAEALSHPSFATIRNGFFSEDQPVSLPFQKFFVSYGGIDRPSKGIDVLLEAVKGTTFNTVIAGRHQAVNQPNVHHINHWISDGEMHHMIKRSECVVLPYLVPSLFSACTALSFRFRKPVLAPFSPGFEKWVDEGKTGWLFSSGDWNSLQERMETIWAGRCKYSAKAIAAKEKEMDNLTKKKLKEMAERFGEL